MTKFPISSTYVVPLNCLWVQFQGKLMPSLDLCGPVHTCGTNVLYHNNILKLKNKIILAKELIDNLSTRLDMAERGVRKLEAHKQLVAH